MAKQDGDPTTAKRKSGPTFKATVSDDKIRYYERRANGVGLIITGCTHVTQNSEMIDGGVTGKARVVSTDCAPH